MSDPVFLSVIEDINDRKKPKALVIASQRIAAAFIGSCELDLP
jgi:hypothetical protein